MADCLKVKVPPQLKNEFFYPEETYDLTVKLISDVNKLHVSDKFLYELSYYNNINCLRPWESAVETVPQLFEKWRQLKNELGNLVDERHNEQLIDLKKTAIATFVQALFWTNNRPVSLDDLNNEVEQLNWKPLNINERLQFIIAKPYLHHSFIQLGELFAELEKQFSVKKASKLD